MQTEKKVRVVDGETVEVVKVTPEKSSKNCIFIPIPDEWIYSLGGCPGRPLHACDEMCMWYASDDIWPDRDVIMAAHAVCIQDDPEYFGLDPDDIENDDVFFEMDLTEYGIYEMMVCNRQGRIGINVSMSPDSIEFDSRRDITLAWRRGENYITITQD